MNACLIALAAGIGKFPLVLLANRDEDYDRPTLHAAFWGEAPDVLGGRDALHLGSWLAITRRGRFAAVTNLQDLVIVPLVTLDRAHEAFGAGRLYNATDACTDARDLIARQVGQDDVTY